MTKSNLDIIPDKSHTFSKAFHQYPSHLPPSIALSASGSKIITNHGEFLDWSMGLGPVIKGYNFSQLNEHIMDRMSHGYAFSLPSDFEFFVAEKLIKNLNFGEQVRFAKNGSDVTSAAIRLSRHITKKEKIICNGYHGWQDWFIGSTSRNGGVQESVKKAVIPISSFSSESLENAVKKNANDLAAIIIEPMISDEPDLEFLKLARQLSDKYGCLLIFDECWTGFRCSKYGAIGYTGIIPDLSCYAKALGNGIPVSAIVGSKLYMQHFEEIFFSFTHSSDPIGLAAADFMLDYLQEPFYKDLTKKSNFLKAELIQIASKIKNEKLKLNVSGYPGKILISPFNASLMLNIKTYIQKKCMDVNILMNMFLAICEDHSDSDLKRLVEVFEIVAQDFNNPKFDVIEETKDILVKPIFRRQE
jgi:glutamate-1-semialdehyde aminotransferase